MPDFSRREMLKLSTLALGASAAGGFSVAEQAPPGSIRTGNRVLAEWAKGNRTLIAEAYNPPFFPSLDYRPERGVEIARALDCDSFRYPAASYVAYFPSSSGYPVHPELKGDPMKEQLSLLRDAGLRPIAYVPLNHPFMFHGEGPSHHEEWKRRRPDGSPMVTKHYGFGDLEEGCINSPVRNVIKALVKEVLSYDFDVMYFDGPYQGMDNATQWCYCQFCKDAYRKRFVEPLPIQDRASLDEQIRYTNWMREEVTLAFLNEMRTLVRSIHDVPVLFNNSELLTAGGQWRARGIPHADGFMYEAADSPEEKLFNLQLGKSTGRTTWTYVGHHTQYNREHLADKSVRGWYSYPIEGEELLMDGAIANASSVGAVYWSAGRFFYEDVVPTSLASGKYVSEIFQFRKTNDALFRKLETRPQVGILVNAEAMSWCREPIFDPTTYKNYYHGAFQLMKALSYDAEPFLDWQMNGEMLFRYSTIYVPNAPCLSDEQCDMLREYVRAGGNLIATHRTSVADRYGRTRKDFGLADVFGVSLKSNQPYEFPDLYLRAKGFDDVPQDPQVLHVDATVAEILFQTWNRGLRRSEGPAVTRNRFGQGTCIYIASGLEALFLETGIESLLHLLESIFAPMLSETQLYRLKFKPGLMAHYTAVQGSDKVVLHVIANISNASPHSKVRQQFANVENVEIQLRTPRPVRSAVLLRSGASLTFTEAGGWTTFTIPNLHIYEAILIGLA